jgi:hypothetical protein
MDILLCNKNRKGQGQHQYFLILREQKRIYSNEMKENETTKAIHITEREGKKTLRTYVPIQ